MSGEKERSYDANRPLKKCLVDQGRAHAALVVAAGGGIVEGYPHDRGGKKKSLLYSGTRTLFQRAGFEYVGSKGMGNRVMRRTVP